MLKKIVIIISALIFPLNLLINYFYSQPLYSLGVDLILQMQSYSNPFLDNFFIFFTILVDPMLIISGCGIFMLVMKRKLTAFITVIFILFNTYFLTISKSFYSAPRPYWTHHEVRNIGYYCPKDYGNPSGHAEFAAVIASVFIFEFLDKKK
jgi:membrane-associated phospholipid phosphatase